MEKRLYDYFLPPKNLALTPASPRDSSKLFVYETASDKIYFDRFYHLDRYLSQNSFLVLNNTKVLPARVVMKKQTGGKVILLFLVNELTSLPVIKALADRKIKVGELIYFGKENFLKVVGQRENIFYLKFNFPLEKLLELIKKYGTMPLPLYLKKTPLKKGELLEKYQTIFAKKEGSCAAPTASLHFTKRVFDKLEKKGIKKYFITLHVGLGTFAPVRKENLKEKKLHEEFFEISPETFQLISQLKKEGKKLVAVGTTVVRSLESVARRQFFSCLPAGRSSPSSPTDKLQKQVPSLQKTDLFIFPPFNFKMVDILITNFHLPKSSLMMLVEAFLQHKGAKKHLVDLYNIAIKNNFRFYSFGDCMLVF